MEYEIDISDVKLDKTQFSVLVYYSNIAELSERTFYNFILDLTRHGVKFSENTMKNLKEIAKKESERVKFISEVLIKLKEVVKNED